MRRSILTETYSGTQWLTTADLARMVERSRRGALWIATQEALTCARTTQGYRLFRESDVMHLVKRRADARLRNVTAYRPRKLGVVGEPHQLPLW